MIRKARKNGQRSWRSKRHVTENASYWEEKAYTAGCLAASSGTDEPDPQVRLNSCWNHWYQSARRLPWPQYHSTANRFIEGYCQHSGLHAHKWILFPTNQKVSVIVSVMNERETIQSILEQLNRLPLHEIIFVVNGSTDESFEMIRNQSQATIVHYHHPLGHDVGRAIGAKLAEAEILLFLDGDFPVFAEHLVPFVDAIEQGLDIALNNISPYLERFSSRDDVSIIKEFINRSMARSDLRANSLTAIPHAMRQQAALQIGYSNLAIPPKAQVIAMEKGLKIGSPASVDVITRNRTRASNIGRNNAVSELIVGDHIEALNTVLEWKGPRLSFPDQIRRRQVT